MKQTQWWLANEHGQPVGGPYLRESEAVLAARMHSSITGFSCKVIKAEGAVALLEREKVPEGPRDNLDTLLAIWIAEAAVGPEKLGKWPNEEEKHEKA